MKMQILAASLLLAATTGCENLPGSRETQGAVIGGAVGSAAGAAVYSENRLLGALVGGAIGAGGGYLIGAKTDWFDDPDRDRHTRAALQDAATSPATVNDVRRSSTADLNRDGFVTTDELTAMERAGLSDAQILDRLRDTGQVFDLSRSQQRDLRAAGVSSRVIAEMPDINREERDDVLGRG